MRPESQATLQGDGFYTILAAVLLLVAAGVLIYMIVIFRRLRASEEKARLDERTASTALARDSGEPLFFRKYVPPAVEHRSDSRT